MATRPDAHPDSAPPARSDDIERVSPDGGEQRETVEDSPAEDDGAAP